MQVAEKVIIKIHTKKTSAVSLIYNVQVFTHLATVIQNTPVM